MTTYNKVEVSTNDSGQTLHFVEFELYDTSGLNVALLGTASQTSTFITAVASFGNDGNTVQIASEIAFAGTQGTGTWTLDLAQSYTMAELSHVVIYNRLGNVGEEDRFAGATIKLVSTDGLETVQIGTGTVDLIQTFNVNPSFNQVTLSTLTTGNVLNFTEFELYDTNGTNIALLGTASQTSTFQTAVASIGNNGFNDGTVASGDTYSFAHTTSAGTWTLDLAQSYLKSELSEAIFYNRITNLSEDLRTIGMIISLHSVDGLVTEQIGVCTSDYMQTFVITEKNMVITPSISTLSVAIADVAGGLIYRTVVTDDSSGNKIYDKYVTGSITGIVQEIRSLSQETAYTVTLYVDSGSGMELFQQENVQTLTNSAGNYNISDLEESGTYDLSILDSLEASNISDVLGDLFSTGDKLSISLSGKSTLTTFVQLGETVSTTDPVVAPFNTSSGSGQVFTLQLSDNTTTDVDFNELNNSITIGGVEYAEGQGFVLDGKKCYMKDL